MIERKTLWVLAMAAALTAWGCEDRGGGTAPAGGEADQEEVMEENLEAATDAAEATTPETPATAAVEDEAEQAEAAASEQAEQAAEESTAAASSALEQARPLLEQARTYIEENKYDLAEKSLTQIEQMEGLPESFMQQVEDARQLLTARRKMNEAQDAGDKIQGMLGDN